jgi:hypothetical protein
VIPSNVAEAVNFYQPRGIVRGRRVIRAADPERTHTLGNFWIDCQGARSSAPNIRGKRADPSEVVKRYSPTCVSNRVASSTCATSAFST